MKSHWIQWERMRSLRKPTLGNLHWQLRLNWVSRGPSQYLWLRFCEIQRKILLYKAVWWSMPAENISSVNWDNSHSSVEIQICTRFCFFAMDEAQNLGAILSNWDVITLFHFGISVWGAAAITWRHMQTSSEPDFSGLSQRELITPFCIISDHKYE